MGAPQDLNERIIECSLCPRLVAWREEIGRSKRRAFSDQEYWARPVPNFGDPNADRLILGLAPGAHGSNRTGRMFTGDRSGEWLFRALFEVGVARQPISASAEDELTLRGVLISAAVHCAPPGNKPTAEELVACRPFLSELLCSRRWKSVLCLGAVAWTELFRTLGLPRPAPFRHCVAARLDSGLLAVASYHPSQQNTFTGKLSFEMLLEAMRQFLEVRESAASVVDENLPRDFESKEPSAPR